MMIKPEITAPMIFLVLLVFPCLSNAGMPNHAEGLLKKKGIRFSLVYYGDTYANIAGGLKKGVTYVGNLHLDLNVDMDRLAGWRGADFFFYGLSIHGGRPSRFTGDAQGACNKEGPRQWWLEEAWFQQNLFENRLSVLAGIYNLNSEFYSLQSAGLFLNSSFGIGPEFSQSGIEGPSIFPRTSLGLRLAFQPAREVVLLSAVFDGAPLERPDGNYALFQKGDGLLLISELDLLSRPYLQDRSVNHGFRIGRLAHSPPYDSKIAVGGWYYATTLRDLSETGADGEPLDHHGSGGGYILADKTFLSDRGGRRLAGFFQVGIGDERVNRFGFYTGGGLVASGLFGGERGDKLGLGVAMAFNGSHYMKSKEKLGVAVRKEETAFELTYRRYLSKWLSLQPSLQYIIAPNTDPALRNALAFQLLLEVTR